MRKYGETFIYTLIDPRNQQVRYVGYAQDPKERLRKHITSSKRLSSHKACWIKSLLKLKLKPEMEIIECVNVKDRDKQEKYWIAYYRSLGFDLTNGTDGGDCSYTLTDETRSKISQATHKQWEKRRSQNYQMSEDQKIKIGIGNKGKVRSQEAREKYSKARKGKPWTQARRDAYNRQKEAIT